MKNYPSITKTALLTREKLQKQEKEAAYTREGIEKRLLPQGVENRNSF